MLIQAFFSIGMKSHDKIFVENCFLSVNLLILIFHQFYLKGFLKVTSVNTKKNGREALINSALSSWNDIQKYFSSNKMLRDVPTFKLKSLLRKHFLVTYNTS